MSYGGVVNTEHSGGKNGGGYWGHRAEAKERSNKVRRRHDYEAVNARERQARATGTRRCKRCREVINGKRNYCRPCQQIRRDQYELRFGLHMIDTVRRRRDFAELCSNVGP